MCVHRTLFFLLHFFFIVLNSLPQKIFCVSIMSVNWRSGYDMNIYKMKKFYPTTLKKAPDYEHTEERNEIK